MRAILFVVLMAVAGQGAADGFLNGSELLQQCESRDYMEKALCLGYLTAVSDSISDHKLIFPNASSPGYYTHNDTCPPENSSFTVGQIEKVWVKWANENPERLHRSAYGLVVVAFVAAWPCN